MPALVGRISVGPLISKVILWCCRAAMTALRCAVALVVALAAVADAATAPGLFSILSGTCGLAAYRDPGPDDERSMVTVTTPTSDGLRFEGSCGAFDAFNFAPDLSQYFLGRSYAFAMGVSAPGVLRLYGEVGAEGSPVTYDVGFVIGTNPYRARSQLGTSIGFADVIVPPAGSGAPNVGDPTTIKAVFRLDCVESELVTLVNTGAGVAVYTPSAYANDEAQYDGLFLTTDYGSFHTACQLTNAELHNEFAATVGTPVVVALTIGTSLRTGILPVIFPFSSLAKYVLSSNALNTATLVITSADGAPLTGQSGKTYSAPGPLPTVTTSSTVTTTSSVPPTTTTLVGCAGTCGDGTVESTCGETCECPATADPIQAAYGCEGATIVPPQEACITCRGCQLIEVRCAVVLPTTTTTTVGTSSTTLPDACAGSTGAAAARCVIDGFLAEDLCLDGPPAAKLEAKFRKRLGAVRKTLERALAASARKRDRLQRAAIKKLAAVGKRAAALAGKKLSEACAIRIGGVVGDATQRIEGS